MSRIVMVVLIVVGLELAVGFVPALACTVWDGCVDADREAGGFGYYYDRATQTFYPEGALDGSETVDGVRIQLKYVVNCIGNTT
ncbi:MAG: hypothetical protein ACRDVO_05290, partial [Jiangellaceae bacterium]